MKEKERIKKFIELQEKKLKFEDIASELGIAKSTLRVFLNKNGYKMNNGKYELKAEADEFNQIEFEESKTSNKKRTTRTKENKNSTTKDVKVKVTTKTKQSNKNKQNEEKYKINIKEEKSKSKAVKKVTPKRDRKINLTQEDLDKLCEVYDWYMNVKDLKTMKSKTKTNKKDIKIETTNIEELKSTSIKVDKNTWEDFERLCSNSQYSKQEIITQALKDFMREYKNML